MIWLTLLALLCVGTISSLNNLGAFGQDADNNNVNAFQGSAQPQGGPSPFVEVTHVFPDPKSNDRIVLGEVAEILAAFANVGEGRFNITGLQAYLMHPLDRSLFVQNVLQAKLISVLQNGHYRHCDSWNRDHPCLLVPPRPSQH